MKGSTNLCECFLSPSVEGRFPKLPGITTYSPLRHWKVDAGSKVGVPPEPDPSPGVINLLTALRQIDAAYERMLGGDVKFRFVIDLESMQAAV